MSALTTYTSVTRARNAVTHLVTTRASALTVSFHSGRIVSVRGKLGECGNCFLKKWHKKGFWFAKNLLTLVEYRFHPTRCKLGLVHFVCPKLHFLSLTWICWHLSSCFRTQVQTDHCETKTIFHHDGNW